MGVFLILKEVGQNSSKITGRVCLTQANLFEGHQSWRIRNYLSILMPGEETSRTKYNLLPGRKEPE